MKQTNKTPIKRELFSEGGKLLIANSYDKELKSTLKNVVAGPPKLYCLNICLW